MLGNTGRVDDVTSKKGAGLLLSLGYKSRSIVVVSYNRAALILLALFATSGCGGTSAVPAGANYSAFPISGLGATNGALADTTSMLKKLKKDVVIGSTVDPKNGDAGPRAISIVRANNVLKPGQLLVCNFDDKAGKAGQGTTIEVLDPKPGSQPKRVAQSNDIEGCDGVAVTGSDQIFASGLLGKAVVEFTVKGSIKKKYSGAPFGSPFTDFNNGKAPKEYQPDYLWVSDVDTGSIISYSVDFFGNGNPLQVATGFAVNKSGPAARLGPSGLQYDAPHDILYIVDGMTNTLVEFTGASDLLEKDEIVVLPGGKTFKCEAKKFTCGKLIYSGSPLDAPLAATLLPNGNLIVANTKGKANTLVEVTPAGQVLDTRVVDTSGTQGVFGLAASGTADSNTILYFTDKNDNSVHELEP